MEKLELKHLAPYLPYGLKVDLSPLEHFNLDDESDVIVYIDEWMYGFSKNKKVGFSDNHYRYVDFNICKPILRPLSDLEKEIDHNGERFVPIKWFESNINKSINIYLPINKDMDLEIDIETEDYSQTIDLFDGYISVQKLLEWHFDVFGLIDKGLAIDINTIK